MHNLFLTQPGFDMNHKQKTNIISLFVPTQYGTKPTHQTHYLWEQIITETKTHTNWLSRIMEGSILNDFWSVISSPIKEKKHLQKISMLSGGEIYDRHTS